MGWWSGSKTKVKQHSLLSQGQEPLQEQLQNSAMGKGASGAYGDVADYYRGNLSINPEDFNAFAAPQLRQYNQDIIPGISEQFAGMGSGGLSSSGFRNAQVQGATDLSERLGAIRANLRQSSAQGLQQIGQQALNPTTENMMYQGQPGFGQSFATGLGNGIGQAATSFATGGLSGFSNPFAGKAQTNSAPYGNNGMTSSARPSSGNGFNLPSFGGR
jgi:hypothetical protein